MYDIVGRISVTCALLSVVRGRAEPKTLTAYNAEGSAKFYESEKEYAAPVKRLLPFAGDFSAAIEYLWSVSSPCLGSPLCACSRAWSDAYVFDWTGLWSPLVARRTWS